MRYAGDVSSGTICTKSAAAERPAGPAIADIEPHCTMSQQCLKTSLQIQKTESQVSGTQYAIVVKYVI